MRTLIFAIGLSTALVSPAVAQEGAPFTGPRVEITTGLDQLRFDLETIGGAGRTKQSDLGYGLTLGYDTFLTPQLIAGLEASVNLSDGSTSIESGTTSGYARKRRELALAARIGAPISDAAFIYGKLGYANLQVRQELQTDSLIASNRTELDGILLGAGAEVQVTPRLFLKSEYRYTDYADGFIANNIITGVGLRF